MCVIKIQSESHYGRDLLRDYNFSCLTDIHIFLTCSHVTVIVYVHHYNCSIFIARTVNSVSLRLSCSLFCLFLDSCLVMIIIAKLSTFCVLLIHFRGRGILKFIYITFMWFVCPNTKWMICFPIPCWNEYLPAIIAGSCLPVSLLLCNSQMLIDCSFYFVFALVCILSTACCCCFLALPHLFMVVHF